MVISNTLITCNKCFVSNHVCTYVYLGCRVTGYNRLLPTYPRTMSILGVSTDFQLCHTPIINIDCFNILQRAKKHCDWAQYLHIPVSLCSHTYWTLW